MDYLQCSFRRLFTHQTDMGLRIAAGVEGGGGRPRVHRGEVRSDRDVGAQVLHRLESADRSAELVSLLRVQHGHVEQFQSGTVDLRGAQHRSALRCDLDGAVGVPAAGQHSRVGDRCAVESHCKQGVPTHVRHRFDTGHGARLHHSHNAFPTGCVHEVTVGAVGVVHGQRDSVEHAVLVRHRRAPFGGREHRDHHGLAVADPLGEVRCLVGADDQCGVAGHRQLEQRGGGQRPAHLDKDAGDRRK